MKITKIPVAEGFHAGSGTVPTGPIQIGGDWPGLFVRGDDCGSIADRLQAASIMLDKLPTPTEPFDISRHRQIKSTLDDLCRRFLETQVRTAKERHDVGKS